jgi:thiamine monophosphate kinase
MGILNGYGPRQPPGTLSNMSDPEVGCFGKLPFNLLESLQADAHSNANYWADAILVPGAKKNLTSIDTISLDRYDLPNSVTMAIVHSTNDLFAANGIPLWFSISMILPLGTDSDVLAQINSAIRNCAKMTGCKLGKLHTIRADGISSATVCVTGKSMDISSNLPKKGDVILVGNEAPFNPSQLVSEVSVRKNAAKTIRGPKKDISGDGLAGALIQLTRRHQISIKLSKNFLRSVACNAPIDLSVERNFLDYAASIGSEIPSTLLSHLFKPHLFGPLICLTDATAEIDRFNSTNIGTFESGGCSLRLSES